MVLRVDGRQHPQGVEDRDQHDVDTPTKKLREGHSRDQAAAAPGGVLFDGDAAARVPSRSSSPSKFERSHNAARTQGAGSSSQGSTPADHRNQLDAAAAAFTSFQKGDDPRSSATARPAPISINPNGTSPTQDRPRGWQAMLQSPTQQEDQVMSDREQQIPQLSPVEPNPPQQEALPVLSPAADTEPISRSAFENGNTAATAAPAPAGPASGGPSRPSPLLLPGENTALPATRLGSLRLASPAHGAPLIAGAPGRPIAMARPDLRIQPPPSPCDAGCTTPTGMPYHGPRMTEAEVDYDLIDGIKLADSNPNSGNSSPSIAAAAGAAYTRSGGLRSSRETDLRRMAMANHLLHSPRPASLSVIQSGPQPMFTGETRARALSGNVGTASSSLLAPVAPNAEGAAEGAAVAASPGAAAETAAATDTAQRQAAQLQRLFRQTNAGSQGSSPASAVSPAGPSILATAGGQRSLPGTPGSLQQRFGSSAAVPSSSRSSSMTASPVPPPTLGPAAALLAGAVGASPQTPRSPLSVMYSPYSTRGGHSGAGTPLPPPLFAGASAVGSPRPGGFGSPRPGGFGSAGLPPTGRTSMSNIAGMLSPPHTSRLRREYSGPVAAQDLPAAPPAAGGGGEPAQDAAPAAAGEAATEAAQQMETDQQHRSYNPSPTPMDLDLQSSGELSVQQTGGTNQQSAVQGHEHFPQVLRQRLQVTDTRFGPHGESPLSPSHHSHMLQQHRQSHGESLLSPTCPTPLVQPAMTAAAATGMPDAAAASEAAAAYAAARAVGVVGRRNVHEWLDQHSWPFLYELPHNLRDAAHFTHSQRLGSLGNMLPLAAATNEGGTAAGYSLQQQQQQHEDHFTRSSDVAISDGLLSPGSDISTHGAAATQLDPFGLRLSGRAGSGVPGSGNHGTPPRPGSQAEPTAHSGSHQSRLASLISGATAPTSISANNATTRARPLDWAFGRLRVSVDQSGPSGGGLSSTGSSRLGAQGLAASSILGSGRSDALGFSRRPGSGLRRQSASSIGDIGAAEDTPVDTGVPFTMDSGAAMQLAPAVPSASPAAAAAAANSGTPADGSGYPGSAAYSGRRAASASSSSARLLSPGSHFYMPGSPVVDQSCCSSCPPVLTGLHEDLPVPALVAASMDAGGSGSVNSATAAAELLRSSMAAVAAATEDDKQQVCRDSSRRDEIRDFSRQSEPLSPGVAADAAAVSELSPPTPALQSVMRLMSASQPRAPEAEVSSIPAVVPTGHIVKQLLPGKASANSTETEATAGPKSCTVCSSAAAKPSATTPGSKLAGPHGMMDMIRDQLLQQVSYSVGGAGAAVGADDLALGKQFVLLAMLSDEQYMHALLSSLPGVDPGAPEVQQAVSQLQMVLKHEVVVEAVGHA